MHDATDLLNMIKIAATEAVNASKPAGVVFGKVVGVQPLQIKVEQKMILGSAQLALTSNVTDYTTKISAERETEKEITIHNRLAVGEEVILFRQQGGQKYIVLDRCNQ